MLKKIQITFVSAITILLIGIPQAHALTLEDINFLASIGLIPADKIELAKTVAEPAGGNSSTCAPFSRTLALGSADITSGGDVSRLQNYLGQRGFYKSSVTGIFDVPTQSAVQSFQSQKGIVNSGGPATTGYGVFGPRTRQVVNLECGGSVSQTGSSSTGSSSLNDFYARLARESKITNSNSGNNSDSSSSRSGVSLNDFYEQLARDSEISSSDDDDDDDDDDRQSLNEFYASLADEVARVAAQNRSTSTPSTDDRSYADRLADYYSQLSRNSYSPQNLRGTGTGKIFVIGPNGQNVWEGEKTYPIEFQLVDWGEGQVFAYLYKYDSQRRFVKRVSIGSFSIPNEKQTGVHRLTFQYSVPNNPEMIYGSIGTGFSIHLCNQACSTETVDNYAGKWDESDFLFEVQE